MRESDFMEGIIEADGFARRTPNANSLVVMELKVAKRIVLVHELTMQDQAAQTQCDGDR